MNLRNTSMSGRAGLFAICGLLLMAPVAAADSGGTSVPGSEPPPPGPAPTSGTPGKAKLLKSGKALAPADAPAAVVAAIRAGNRIRKKPYIYGGGHRNFEAKGYDCSGAVSYVLHAAGILSSPLPSGSLMKWGSRGRGRWITVYAHGGHTYAVIAGLRWDTSSFGSGGKGPRWRATKRSPKGYKVRHSSGF